MSCALTTELRPPQGDTDPGGMRLTEPQERALQALAESLDYTKLYGGATLPQIHQVARVPGTRLVALGLAEHRITRNGIVVDSIRITDKGLNYAIELGLVS